MPVSWDEQTRQVALEHYHILDTVREQAFDELVELASALLQAPIALINFVGTDRQWFKAEIGLGCDELPLAGSICEFAILQSDVFVVTDLTKDRRYDGNVLIRAANGPRFYAGAVLETKDGLPLGTICVLDTEPRSEGITEWQRKGLKALAAQTMALLDYHVAARNYRFLTELNHVFQRVLSSGELIRTTVAALGAHLDVAHCGFAEIDAAQEYAQIDHEYGDGRIPSVVGRWHLRDFGGPLIDDILAGNTTVIPDIAADPRTNAADALAAFANIHTRAIFGVPLVRDGKVFAMLVNHHPTARRWTAAEVELFEEVCRRLWGAVERARARETVKASTTELEALLASAPIGIAYFDREHRYVRINDELAQSNGATIEAHLGQTLEHMIPELATAVVPHLDKVFATGSASREIEISGETPRAPGKIYHWLVSFFPVFGDNDAVASVGAFVVDITTRKQVEVDLAANVAWLREAQEYGGVGSWKFDYEQKSGRVSSTYLSLHDFNADEYTMGAARLMEAMHPDDREPFRKAVKRGLQTRERTSCDYRIITKDGKARWMRSIGRMLDDEDGTPTLRSSGIVEDVTLERQSLDKLRQSNRAMTAASTKAQERAAEIESIYVSAPVGLCVIDTELRYVRINERMAVINGIAAADYIGRHVRDIVPDLADQALALMNSVLAGEVVRNVEIVGTTALQPGVVRTWRENWVPLRSEDGVIIGITASAEEITEEKRQNDELEQARNALRQLNVELEKRVIERTDALQRANADLAQEYERQAELQAKLVQAQKLEALGQMTSGFAHDFNNTIQGIRSGYAVVEGIAPELPRLTKPFRQSELAEKLREFDGRLAYYDTTP